MNTHIETEQEWPNIEARSALRIANENLRALREQANDLEESLVWSRRREMVLAALLLALGLAWFLSVN